MLASSATNTCNSLKLHLIATRRVQNVWAAYILSLYGEHLGILQNHYRVEYGQECSLADVTLQISHDKNELLSDKSISFIALKTS